MKKDGLPDYAALMVVGVDAYQLGVPEGRLFNCYLESYIPFYGFMDLFLRIDQILDALDHPQATFERRWLSGRDLDNMAAKPPSSCRNPLWCGIGSRASSRRFSPPRPGFISGCSFARTPPGRAAWSGPRAGAG